MPQANFNAADQEQNDGDEPKTKAEDMQDHESKIPKEALSDCLTQMGIDAVKFANFIGSIQEIQSEVPISGGASPSAASPSAASPSAAPPSALPSKNVEPSQRTPIPDVKAGNILMDYGNQHGMAIVTIGQDGKCTLIGATVSPKVWRGMSRHQKASYYRLREDLLAGVPRPPPRTPKVRSPPPPLRPLATEGMNQDHISSMMSILQAQNDMLRRLQEKQALANAQIMTSIFFLTDTFKTRLEIQSDLEEDQEEQNGIQIEELD